MTAMHPPANRRCQIYGNTSVRCINDGTHWIKWGGGCCCNGDECHWTKWGGDCSCEGDYCAHESCEKDFYSWECDGPHLFGEGNSASMPQQREAA